MVMMSKIAERCKLKLVSILFLVKDRDITRNIKIHKHLHLKSTYAAITSFRFLSDPL